MSELSDYRRLVSDPLEVKLRKEVAAYKVRVEELEALVSDLQDGLSLSTRGDQSGFIQWRNSKIMKALRDETEKLRSMPKEDAKAYVLSRQALKGPTNE